MSVPRSVAEVLAEHVTLEVEGIDRMYLNVYVPGLQREQGVVETPVFRTERRRNEKTGARYPWLVRSTAMVNHFYIYCVDRDFGPFFLKFCTYFPYNAKLCLNGHEYAKQQLTKKGIGFKALDNGVLECDDP